MSNPALLWAELTQRPLALLAFGAVVGVLLTLLLVVRGLRREITALRAARAEADAALALLQEARQEQAVQLARVEERAALADPLEKRVGDLQSELIAANDARARLESELRTTREAHAARVEELRLAQADMDKRFDQLAARALEQNNDRFLKSVSERFAQHKQAADNDLGARQKGIETLLAPVHQNLAKFEARVGEIERTREGAYRSIAEQVRNMQEEQIRLRTETSRLVTALRAPKTRGNWGEFQLRKVVEMAGMVDHVDFHMEVSTTDSEGQRQRPDATVNLPGGKRIVIDAKTPLEGYLNAAETEDPVLRDTHLATHARQLRTQMQNLSRKSYFDVIAGSPDFVVMFIPGEAFYSSALASDPTLFEDAIRNRVIIATPTTLIALLKSVAYGWQQERMSQNAQEAVELAQELYKRFGILGERLEKLGKSISNTVRDFNGVVTTTETRLLPQARKFEGLSIARSGDALPDIEGVDAEVRQITATELRASDETE